MRIAIVPFSSLLQFDKNSMFLVFLDFAEWCFKNNKNVFFYWFIPHHAEGFLKNKLGDKENNKIIAYEQITKNYYDSFYTFDTKKFYLNFSRLGGKYPVDAVMTNSSAAIFLLQRLSSDIRRTTEYLVPVFCLEPTVKETRLIMSSQKYMFLDDYIRAVGYTTGNPIFLTTEEMSYAAKFTKKYVSPSMIKRMLERSTVLPLVVRTDLIDKLRQEIPKRTDKKVLFWGGRMSRVKRVDKIVKEYDYLFRFGRDLEIVITTSSLNERSYREVFKNAPEVRLLTGMGREDYLKEAVQAHILFLASETEGFPVGFFEQMYAGLLPILPDKKWARATMIEGYPFFYRNRMEGAAMLRELYDNYEKYEIEWSEKIREYIRNNFNEDKVFGRLYEEIEKAIQPPKSYRLVAKNSFQLVEDSVKTFDQNRFSLEELIQRMRALSKTFNPASRTRNKSFSIYEIYRSVLELGYQDECKKEMPFFVKKGNDNSIGLEENQN